MAPEPLGGKVGLRILPLFPPAAPREAACKISGVELSICNIRDSFRTPKTPPDFLEVIPGTNPKPWVLQFFRPAKTARSLSQSRVKDSDDVHVPRSGAIHAAEPSLVEVVVPLKEWTNAGTPKRLFEGHPQHGARVDMVEPMTPIGAFTVVADVAVVAAAAAY